MSLAGLREREVKGKKNTLPKLRTVLASPYKQHSPVLSEKEQLEFQTILKEAINVSKHTQKTFATKTQIHLGLESSLRAINGSRFSCVLISLSLRPSHLIRLIATSAAVRVPTAPIYAQPKLEEITHELFGVRTMALVLPLNLNEISSKLAEWVSARKKVIIPKSVKPSKPKPAKKQKVNEELKINWPIQPKEAASEPEPQKDWSGDYISCFNDGEVYKLDQNNVVTETQALDTALNNLAMRGQRNKEIAVKSPSPHTMESSPKTEPMQIDTINTEDEADEFLPAELADYQPLTVHQVRANPDKKPKKKRNKNKSQKQPPQQKSN